MEDCIDSEHENYNFAVFMYKMKQAGLPFVQSGLPAAKCLKRTLLHALFVLLNHFLGHVSANCAGLLGGNVAVIALLESNAHFGRHFILKALKSLARIGYQMSVSAGHSEFTSF
jgi:hypothetical protein